MSETITYTKLDGTTISCKSNEPETVLDSWVFERILMSSTASLRERKIASRFKLQPAPGFVPPVIEDPDDEEFKLLWVKFLADPNVKITN